MCLTVCPNGYYSSGSEQCSACAVSGCAICSSVSSCSGCTDTNNYIVASSYCSATCPSGNNAYVNSYGYKACDNIICDSGFAIISGLC